MGLEDIERMVDQAIGFGMEIFEISGGEPLILAKPLLLEALRYLSRRGMLTTLSTNAYRLDKEYASELAGAGLDKIKFSLYGANPQTHDEFTGAIGSFDRVIRGIETSKEEGMEVTVHFLITPKNLKELPALPSLLRPRDVDAVQLGSIVPSGRGRTAEGYVFTGEGLEEVTGTLKKSFSHLLYRNYFFTNTLFPDSGMFPLDGRYCDYFTDRLVIDPKGNIIPCCILPENLRSRLGNIREEGLSEIYSAQRIWKEPIFYWLYQGHKAMRRRLGYDKVSHNLCSLCINILSRLKEPSE